MLAWVGLARLDPLHVVPLLDPTFSDRPTTAVRAASVSREAKYAESVVQRPRVAWAQSAILASPQIQAPTAARRAHFRGSFGGWVAEADLRWLWHLA